MLLTLWTNTFDNLDKFISQFGQIHLANWTNTSGNLDKYSCQFGQIHLAIWTNTFCNLDSYIKMVLQGGDALLSVNTVGIINTLLCQYNPTHCCRRHHRHRHHYHHRCDHHHRLQKIEIHFNRAIYIHILVVLGNWFP